METGLDSTHNLLPMSGLAQSWPMCPAQSGGDMRPIAIETRIYSRPLEALRTEFLREPAYQSRNAVLKMDSLVNENQITSRPISGPVHRGPSGPAHKNAVVAMDANITNNRIYRAHRGPR